MFSAGASAPVALMRHSALRRTRTGLDCPLCPVSACTRGDSPFHPHAHDLTLSGSPHYCAAVSFLFQSQDSRPTHLRASAVQKVRGLSSAAILPPAAALPLSHCYMSCNSLYLPAINELSGGESLMCRLNEHNGAFLLISLLVCRKV